MHVPPVVVGVDGSDSALGAVRWAARAAVLRSVPLLLVASNAVRPDVFGDATYLTAGARARLEKFGRERLDIAEEHATACVGDAHITVHTTSRGGAPAAVLLELAHSAAMIVVGSRGLGDITGGLIGSVSIAVATHAACPVVIVRPVPEPPEADPQGPVVVGVDGSARSEPAVDAAFVEAELRGTELVAVHAWSDFDLGTVFTTDVNDRDLGWDAIAVAEEAVLSEALAGRREAYPGVAVRKVVVRDRPVQTLIEQSHHAQLVVTGSRGRGGFAALLLGSTSRALLHGSRCPLMIVRS